MRDRVVTFLLKRGVHRLLKSDHKYAKLVMREIYNSLDIKDVMLFGVEIKRRIRELTK